MADNGQTTLVTFIIPEGLDPARYLEDAIKPEATWHFAVTEDSAALTIERQQRVIDSLQAHVDRLIARRSNAELNEYILRLHKSDSRRMNGKAGGVAMQICQHCSALIVEDSLLDHEERCALRPITEQAEGFTDEG